MHLAPNSGRIIVDRELLELKREFLGEAEQKASEIQRMLEGEPDSASIERLGYLAHQLKGAGGSYGYQDISDEAAAIEKAVEAQNEDPKLQQHSVSLREAIARAQRDLGNS